MSDGSEHQNVVMVTADSLRADHCGYLGYERNTTPTLDEMANQGLAFEQATAPGSNTLSSMTGIFTGDYLYSSTTSPLRARKQDVRRMLEHKLTLAEHLADQGYTTIAVNPNPACGRYYDFQRGFVHFEDETSSTPLTMLASEKNITIAKYLNYILQKATGHQDWDAQYSTIIDRVQAADEPFFLWVMLLDTHLPYTVRRRRWSTVFNRALIHITNRKINSHGEGRYRYLELSHTERQRLINAYNDSIRFVDDFLRKLRKDLEPYDPAYVFHADHGDGFGEHGFYSHPVQLYDELVHVPLVVSNVEPTARVETPAPLTGLPSTICSLAGVDDPFSGPNLLKDRSNWAVSQAVNDDRLMVSIRGRRWKYIEGHDGGPELFDINDDPSEQNNVIDERESLASELRALTRKYHSRKRERDALEVAVDAIG